MIATFLLFINSCKKDNNINNPTPSVTVTDIDGNVYHIVTIGTQVWMVENLKVTKYRNGDTIPNVTNDSSWNILLTGAYCNYNNNTSYTNTYGNLYNWYAVNDSHNICPTGWHIPNKVELETLLNYLGGSSIAGAKMKEAGTSHWLSPNVGATNESGFTGLPGGSWYNTFGDIGNRGFWWTKTEYSVHGAYFWTMFYTSTESMLMSADKRNGFSIRCIKD